ncbi:DUF2783 domain-containing protein [Rhodobacteraceae bacterium RKSG542]|uniref:DUF2783 domain-containing protein n=1 Tax=Pseudovibrio flavus TaxID=2529854 RepID=UPI0012BCC315|nr:DUF2783 domain-containing protein [Pseudovibrio flavus]MTI16154.1 DUF2783 domain-containing protein [Pseudovibrio flavus]
MSTLQTKPNLKDPDGFYSELLKAHEGKTLEESQQINAKLVLILANHVGDRAVLREALALASDS